jgi:hypothetical protein
MTIECTGLLLTMTERRSSSFQNVSIETLAADGRWTAYAYLDEINVSGNSHNQTDNGIHLQISPVVDNSPSRSVMPDNGQWPDGHMDGEITASNIETTFLQSGFLRSFDSQVLDVEIVGEEPLPSPTRGMLPFSPSTAMIQSPSQWGLSHFGDIDFESSNWDFTGGSQLPVFSDTYGLAKQLAIQTIQRRSRSSRYVFHSFLGFICSKILFPLICICEKKTVLYA